MAKKKKLTRKELVKAPDEFITLSSRAANFILDHKHHVKILAIIMVLILVASIGGSLYLRHINKKGQEAFNAACYFLADNIKPDMDKENLKKNIELFKIVTDKYSMSDAAILAYPQIAHLKFLEKEYDESIGLYQKFLNKISDDIEYVEFKSLTRMSLAACYEAQGNLKKAIDRLKPVVAVVRNPFRELAMLNLERLYRLDNQDQNAERIIQTFVEQYKNSPFFSMARSRFLYYKMKKGGNDTTIN